MKKAKRKTINCHHWIQHHINPKKKKSLDTPSYRQTLSPWQCSALQYSAINTVLMQSSSSVFSKLRNAKTGQIFTEINSETAVINLAYLKIILWQGCYKQVWDINITHKMDMQVKTDKWGEKAKGAPDSVSSQIIKVPLLLRGLDSDIDQYAGHRSGEGESTVFTAANPHFLDLATTLMGPLQH